MKRKVNAALIGIGGFGKTHLINLGRLEEEGILNLAAVCDSNYDKSYLEKVEGFEGKNIRFYNSYSEMLREEKNLDLVTVSTPIHLHKKMACDVLENNCHLLLEKPPVVTIQDYEKIINSINLSNKLCAVNFMYTSSSAFNELSKLIKAGSLGKIKHITGIGLWKRLDSYYARTPWAGKLTINSNYILDGTINNPLAHVLNNMLFLADAAGAREIETVTAELYNAHKIESEDTSCVRVIMNNGVCLNFYATLCNKTQEAPFIEVVGTEGTAYWNSNNELKVENAAGEKVYNFGNENYNLKMYKNLVNVITGNEGNLFCPFERTRNFVLASNGAFESSGSINMVPEKYLEKGMENNTNYVYIKEIENIVNMALIDKKLFSEMNIAWAKRGKLFNMNGYKEFKLFI